MDTRCLGEHLQQVRPDESFRRRQGKWFWSRTGVARAGGVVPALSSGRADSASPAVGGDFRGSHSRVIAKYRAKWREDNPGRVIDDFTLPERKWNLTDWKVLNARWRALHEQLNAQQKQSTDPHNGSLQKITIATPREIKSRGERPARTNLSKLTPETIRARTKSGDMPLHRAAKIGRIYEMPSHLLKIELFMAKNHVGRTPVHFAATYGHLDQIPSEFLTKETITVFDDYGETPLHAAAYHRHADQIPVRFLTLEFLSIHAKNYNAWTPLHIMSWTGKLKVIPNNSTILEKLNSMNRLGQTPHGILKEKIKREASLGITRSEDTIDNWESFDARD